MNNNIPPTSQLKKIETRLADANRLEPFSNRSWRKTIPKKPGIYAVWPKQKGVKAVYIGESSNLSERLRDFGNPANHTFARKIKRKHGLNSTAEVKDHIKSTYVISVLPITFGRAEAEEYLISNWKTYSIVKFNDPIPRRWRCEA